MKSIVITTVFPPTQAVRDFSAERNWRLIVVGDRRTPEGWCCENAHFISASAQADCAPKLSAALPWNHYCRKMVGYVEAVRLDSECIVDTDDDNIPNSDWGFPDAEGFFETTDQSAKFVNVYKAFTDRPIWPRGFPLECILRPESEPLRARPRKVKVGVWQGLADGDPDVDAIYRLTNNEQCFFNKWEPLVLGRGNLCPFNSQRDQITRTQKKVMKAEWDSCDGVREKEKTSGQNGNGAELSPFPKRFAGTDQVGELELSVEGERAIVAVKAVRKKLAHRVVVRRWLSTRHELVPATFSPEEGNIRIVVAKRDHY